MVADIIDEFAKDTHDNAVERLPQKLEKLVAVWPADMLSVCSDMAKRKEGWEDHNSGQSDGGFLRIIGTNAQQAVCRWNAYKFTKMGMLSVWCSRASTQALPEYRCTAAQEQWAKDANVLCCQVLPYLLRLLKFHTVSCLAYSGDEETG